MKKILSSALLAFLILGCAATRSDMATLYDLGPPDTGIDSTAPAALPAISIAEINAPAWLDSPLMFFRLNYANAQQPRPYARARWTMAPAQLFGQRLKSRLAQAGGVVLAAADGAQNLPLLRIEVDDFTQNFDSPTHSSVQVTMRASVFNGRTLAAQKNFAGQASAPSADAAGGAHALRAASDAVIADMMNWLAGLSLKKNN
jgi:cholesterol transport system auxiliary component